MVAWWFGGGDFEEEKGYEAWCGLVEAVGVGWQGCCTVLSIPKRGEYAIYIRQWPTVCKQIQNEDKWQETRRERAASFLVFRAQQHKTPKSYPHPSPSKKAMVSPVDRDGAHGLDANTDEVESEADCLGVAQRSLEADVPDVRGDSGAGI